MLGTIVNVGCIIVGSTVGTIAKKALGDKYTEVLFNALGLASIVLGCNAAVSHMGKSEYPVLFIMSLAIGGLVGTALDIDGRVKRALEKKGGSNAAQGLTTACLLFCIGTLSIVGPVLSAVEGDNTFLFTNATLDLFSSAMLASTFGIVIIWAAPILLCWQGGIYLTAKFLSAEFFSEGLVNELSTVGGVLIVCTGLSLLKLKDCKTLNLLPGLLGPVIWYLIVG